MRNKKVWGVLILMVFALCSESFGSAEKESRENIKGIQGFVVLADVTGLQEIGINSDKIVTDTELKLRSAGIKVLTKSEANAVPGSPALYIYLWGYKLSDLSVKIPVYSYYIEVSVLQTVLLERKRTVSDWLRTWSTDTMGVRGSANPDAIEKHIRDVNKDLIDKFINAYLSVNLKRTK